MSLVIILQFLPICDAEDWFLFRRHSFAHLYENDQTCDKQRWGTEE